MRERVLFVDDDEIFLDLCSFQLRNQFDVDVARSGAEGLRIAGARGPYAVIVSDMYMPEMDGIEFLAKVRRIAPHSTRMMVTSRADKDTAIEAVNEGNIFRFLVKPCAAEALVKAVAAGVEQYRLVLADKEHLETLQGTTAILTEILGIIDPIAFSRATRLRQLVRHIATALRLTDTWQFELAAVLSQIGCVTLSSQTLEAVYAGGTMSDEDRRQFAAHPMVASQLLSKVPRLRMIAQMIERQCGPDRVDGSAAELGNLDRISVGAQILKVAYDFDLLTSRGVPHDGALEELLTKPYRYNPTIALTLRDAALRDTGTECRTLKIDQLRPEMILDEEVRTNTGLLLVKKDQEVTFPLLLRLQSYWRNRAIPGQLRVRTRTTTSNGSLQNGAAANGASPEYAPETNEPVSATALAEMGL